jgi:hypothetical protein
MVEARSCRTAVSTCICMNDIVYFEHLQNLGNFTYVATRIRCCCCTILIILTNTGKIQKAVIGFLSFLSNFANFQESLATTNSRSNRCKILYYVLSRRVSNQINCPYYRTCRVIHYDHSESIQHTIRRTTMKQTCVTQVL